MIGAKVTGYTLGVGDYVFVALDGKGVQCARIRALIVTAETGLTLDVTTEGGMRYLVKPCKVFTDQTSACNHAFSRRAEIPL